MFNRNGQSVSMRRFAVLIVIFGGCVIIVTLHNPLRNTAKSWPRASNDNLCKTTTSELKNSSIAKRDPEFVYLVQTESCLPDVLDSLEVFCSSDVIVLSYKEKCSKPPKQGMMIEYIVDKSASWAQGRNKLFEVAKQRKKKYLYYIFLDDDIKLVSSSNQDPWRQFEKFLLRVEPAVAAVDMQNYPCIDFLPQAAKHNNCSIDANKEYISAGRFDETLNAFHHKAAGHVLPYPTKYDKISFFFTCNYFAVKLEVTFRGQMVLHTQIKGINTKHRPYTRRDPNYEQLLGMIKDIEQGIPTKYRNKGVLLEWKKYGREHMKTSSTYCLPPPKPHTPVRPFGSFEKSI